MLVSRLAKREDEALIPISTILKFPAQLRLFLNQFLKNVKLFVVHPESYKVIDKVFS